MIEIRAHHQIYFLLADPFTDLVANSMALFAMNALRQHGEVDIAATAPIVDA